jgi:PAS domain S-box-containing protein
MNLDTALDAVIVMDANGQIKEWNPQAESIFGWLRQEVIGQLLSATIIPAEYREAHERGLKHFLATGEGSVLKKRIEITALHRDGHVFPVELTVLPAKLGESYIFSAFVRDITERKRGEEKMRQQNEYLAALHETTLALMNRLEINDLLKAIVMRAAALVGTEHGFIRLVDPGGTAMVMTVGVGAFSKVAKSQLKPGEGVGGKVWQTSQPLIVEDFRVWPGRIPDPSHDIFRAIVGVPLKSGLQTIGMIGLAYTEEDRKFGEEEVTLLSRFAQLASIALDNARLYTAAQQELAERKQIEEKLKLSDLIISTVNTLILVANEHGEITYAGPSIHRMLGYLPEEVLGEGWLKLTRRDKTEDRERERIYLSAAAKGETEIITTPYERQIYDKQGNLHWILFQDTKGSGNSIIGIGSDITKRKQAEQALKEKNEELEKALQQLKSTQDQLIIQEKLASLGALTAGIAHEIKNPLNFVNNFAKFSVDLAKDLREDLSNQRDRLEAKVLKSVEGTLNTLERYAKKIEEHGKRADSIVRNMLLHSRGKSGERQLTDLNGLLAEYVSLAYHGMRARDSSFNITIETSYDASIGLIEVVPQDISRVFLNILNNACYAVHEKAKKLGEGFSPTLWVRTKDLGEQVEIQIRDNGPGIPEDLLGKIFHPFFTTKPTGEGTGLGLSISYDIVVQEHQGEIKVETEEGSYAEFIVVLPKKGTWNKGGLE